MRLEKIKKGQVYFLSETEQLFLPVRETRVKRNVLTTSVPDRCRFSVRPKEAGHEAGQCTQRPKVFPYGKGSRLCRQLPECSGAFHGTPPNSFLRKIQLIFTMNRTYNIASIPPIAYLVQVSSFARFSVTAPGT